MQCKYYIQKQKYFTQCRYYIQKQKYGNMVHSANITYINKKNVEIAIPKGLYY